MPSNEMTTKEIMDVIQHFKQEDPFHTSFQNFRPLLDKLGVGQILMTQIFRGEPHGDNLVFESGEACAGEPLVMIHPCNDEMLWKAIVSRPASLAAWDEDQVFGIRMFLELTFVYGSNSVLYKTAFDALNFDKETGITNLYSYSKFAMQLVGQKRIQNYAAMYINVKNFKLVNKAY